MSLTRWQCLHLKTNTDTEILDNGFCQHWVRNNYIMRTQFMQTKRSSFGCKMQASLRPLKNARRPHFDDVTRKANVNVTDRLRLIALVTSSQHGDLFTDCRSGGRGGRCRRSQRWWVSALLFCDWKIGLPHKQSLNQLQKLTESQNNRSFWNCRKVDDTHVTIRAVDWCNCCSLSLSIQQSN